MGFWLSRIGKLIVDAKDGRGECEELRAHHQHSSRNVVVFANHQTSKSQGHSGKKTAYSHKLFMLTIFHNFNINMGTEQERGFAD